MQIDDAKLTMTLKKTAVLREQLGQMCTGKQGLELSVMDLHYVVGKVYGLEIEMREVSFQAVYLRGKVERYQDNRARVLVRSNLTDTEKRLVAVKELCHLALDEKDDWSTDGAAMLEAILSDSQGDSIPATHVLLTPIESEALALLAAGELMYPADFREADAAKIAAGEMTVSAIALQHEVPPFIVEQALRREAKLKPLRDNANGELGIAA